jgi:hypothetical protein
MKKQLFTISLITSVLTVSTDTFAQGMLGKLKAKLDQAAANQSGEKNSTNSNSKEANKSTLTEFQRKNLKRVIFMSKETIEPDWNGETEADNVSEIELGMPLNMKFYIDNGGWDYEKNKYLDVRYIVDGISFTGRDFVKYAYNMVDKAPGRNTFGQFVKFETANNLESTMMQKSKEMVTANMVSPRGAYIPLLMRAEDTFRYFLATKLKSKLTPGSTLNLKVEIYHTSEATYSPSKPSVDGEVYATGEIKLKVTNLYKQPDNLFNRFFSEGMVSAEHSEGAAKTIQSKFPTTVKKVHKVFFLDQDFATTNHPVTGLILSGSATAWVLFETHDGVLYNTKTKLTFPYNGSGFSKAPTLMESGLEEATFPVIVNPFAK